MLNRLRDKRGAVMESALLFLLVIFLLCFLLTLVALSGHAETEIAESQLGVRLSLEQIAEDFMANPAAYADDPSDAYTVTVAEDETPEGTLYTLTVTAADPPRLDPDEPEAGEAAPTPPVLLTVQLRVERIADAEGNPVAIKTVLAYRYGALE